MEQEHKKIQFNICLHLQRNICRGDYSFHLLVVNYKEIYCRSSLSLESKRFVQTNDIGNVCDTFCTPEQMKRKMSGEGDWKGNKRILSVNFIIETAMSAFPPFLLSWTSLMIKAKTFLPRNRGRHVCHIIMFWFWIFVCRFEWADFSLVLIWLLSIVLMASFHIQRKLLIDLSLWLSATYPDAIRTY